MSEDTLTRGEKRLPFDPAKTADDARLVFIGRVRSSWKTSRDCPKNLRVARELKKPAWLEVESAFRDALHGLEDCSHILVIYWLDQARRDVIVQRPGRDGQFLATFATRSPVRPNPLGVAAVRLMGIDIEAGIVTIDAIDCVDGTPLVDIKPYIPTVDAMPDATVVWLDG